MSARTQGSALRSGKKNPPDPSAPSTRDALTDPHPITTVADNELLPRKMADDAAAKTEIDARRKGTWARRG